MMSHFGRQAILYFNMMNKAKAAVVCAAVAFCAACIYIVTIKADFPKPVDMSRSAIFAASNIAHTTKLWDAALNDDSLASTRMKVGSGQLSPDKDSFSNFKSDVNIDYSRWMKSHEHPAAYRRLRNNN